MPGLAGLPIVNLNALSPSTQTVGSRGTFGHRTFVTDTHVAAESQWCHRHVHPESTPANRPKHSHCLDPPAWESVLAHCSAEVHLTPFKT